MVKMSTVGPAVRIGDMFGPWPDYKKPSNATISEDGRVVAYGPLTEEEIQERILKNQELYPGPERKSKMEQRAEVLAAARAVESAENETETKAGVARNADIDREVEIRKKTFKNYTEEMLYRFDAGQDIAYIAQAMGKNYRQVYSALKYHKRV